MYSLVLFKPLLRPALHNGRVLLFASTCTVCLETVRNKGQQERRRHRDIIGCIKEENITLRDCYRLYRQRRKEKTALAVTATVYDSTAEISLEEAEWVQAQSSDPTNC